MRQPKSLGKQTKLLLKDTLKPNPKLLDPIPVPSGLSHDKYVCKEFTSLCPITGQPDMGKLEIIVTGGDNLVESKSLKLYLFTYRNFGCFHEEICTRIAKDVQKVTGGSVSVHGAFKSRGGISICPSAFCNY